MIKIFCDICGKEIEPFGSMAHSHSHYKVAITSRGRDGSCNEERNLVLEHVCDDCGKDARRLMEELRSAKDVKEDQDK